jgi:hypothetical protein
MRNGYAGGNRIIFGADCRYTLLVCSFLGEIVHSRHKKPFPKKEDPDCKGRLCRNHLFLPRIALEGCGI